MADIRARSRLGHSDILRLNFVQRETPFVFRRYCRAGLRSHIMAVLRPEDLKNEREGVFTSATDASG